jgi:hypothetical protein
VALHGDEGDPQVGIKYSWDPLWKSRKDFLLVMPKCPSSSGSWWSPYAPSAAWLDKLMAYLPTRYNVDRTRVYVWGFSGGGCFLGGYVFDREDTLAAVSHNVGGCYAGSTDKPGACLIPARLITGSNDHQHANVVQLASYYQKLGHETDLQDIPGLSHTFTGIMFGPSVDWLFKHTLCNKPPATAGCAGSGGAAGSGGGGGSGGSGAAGAGGGSGGSGAAGGGGAAGSVAGSGGFAGGSAGAGATSQGGESAGQPCSTRTDCPGGSVCVDDGLKYCAPLCGAGKPECPEGFTCDAALSACFRRRSPDAIGGDAAGCACSAPGPRPVGPAVWLVLGAAAAAMMRRGRSGHAEVCRPNDGMTRRHENGDGRRVDVLVDE